MQWSVSRLNHRLPGCEAHSKVVQSTAQFHHESTNALLPQAHPVFDDATALHTAVDVLDLAPPFGAALTLVETEQNLGCVPLTTTHRLSHQADQGGVGCWHDHHGNV